MGYAKELTKKFLEGCGITEVTEDGRIWKKGKEIKQYPKGSEENHYMQVLLYSPELRREVPKEKRTKSTGQFRIDSHRVCYAWWHDKIDESMVVHHINEIKYDNRKENLDLVTPGENLYISRPEFGTYVYKMPANKKYTWEEIEDKLDHFNDLYSQAKKDHDAKKAHSLRTSLSHWNAIKRQCEENPELYISSEQQEI